jgi:hypothetical protein
MKLFTQTFFFLLLTAHICFGQWEQTNGPYSSPYQPSVQCFTINGTYLFAGTDVGGVFHSTNNGFNWIADNSGLTNTDVYALAVSGTNLFAGTGLGGVFRSTNNGTSWTAVGLTGVRDLAVSSTNLFVGTGHGVFLSTNNGTNWTEINSGLTNTDVWALVVNGTNLFAGTAGGVFRSTNNGTNWTSAGLTNHRIWTFGVSGTNLFAGAYSGVFLSTNNGTSWTEVNSDLTNTFVNTLVVYGTNLFAGTFEGVFHSSDNGTSWTDVSSGLTNTDVIALVVYGANLFAGTVGNEVSVWRRPILEMITSVEGSSKDLPTRFALSQNYPNPFNPTTKISYEIPEAGLVILKVYDLLGNEVAELVNGNRQAGRYKVEFTGGNLASGVYIYKLSVNDFVSTKKMILMR